MPCRQCNGSLPGEACSSTSKACECQRDRSIRQKEHEHRPNDGSSDKGRKNSIKRQNNEIRRAKPGDNARWIGTSTRNGVVKCQAKVCGKILRRGRNKSAPKNYPWKETVPVCKECWGEWKLLRWEVKSNGFTCCICKTPMRLPWPSEANLRSLRLEQTPCDDCHGRPMSIIYKQKRLHDVERRLSRMEPGHRPDIEPYEPVKRTYISHHLSRTFVEEYLRIPIEEILRCHKMEMTKVTGFRCTPVQLDAEHTAINFAVDVDAWTAPTISQKARRWGLVAFDHVPIATLIGTTAIGMSGLTNGAINSNAPSGRPDESFGPVLEAMAFG